jgi:hypothetical protein
MVMVYNSHSLRAALIRVWMLCNGVWRDRQRRAEFVRAFDEADTEGTTAPATEYTSAAEVRRMFAGCSEVRVRRENFDNLVLPLPGRPVLIPRAVCLNNIARIAGTDLYVTATK